MRKKEIGSANSGKIKHTGIPPDNAIKDIKIIVTDKRVETVSAIFLGITTLPTEFGQMNFFEFNK